MPRPATTCTLDGCNRKHKAHGLCYMHYKRSRAGATRLPIDVFWAEYEHFHGYGYTNARIAQRLGIDLESLERRLARHTDRNTQEVA